MWNTSSKRTDLPLIVGITGGIGSGKSLVCSIFRVIGVPVFEADQIAKDLYHTNAELKEKLILMFGREIYSNGNSLNRKLLSSIIFSDSESLRKVNNLIHPLVREVFMNWIQRQNGCYVLHEAAILFESGHYKALDKIILVTAPADIRIKRVMERDGIPREDVLARMAHQWEEEKKIHLADFIIRNDGKEMVIPQVMEVHWKLAVGSRQ